MNDFVFGNHHIYFDKNIDKPVKKGDFILIPARSHSVQQLESNILLFFLDEKKYFLFFSESYAQLSKKYRILFSHVDPSIENYINIVIDANLTEDSLTRFKKLLCSRTNFLENKIKKVDLQISNSKNTLKSYFTNLSRDIEVQTKEHFVNHEIPQEQTRLDYLENKVHETSLQIKFLNVLLCSAKIL